MSSFIKSFNLLVFLSITLLVFNNCCSIPLVDCGPKINRIKLLNDSIVLSKSKNGLMKFGLWEYQQRQKNDRYYNINLNAIIGIHDSLDLSSTKVSIKNSNDTIFTKRPFLLKDTIIESHRNIVYSLDFNVVSYENYDFIIFNNIKIFDKEENKWIDYSHKVQILN